MKKNLLFSLMIFASTTTIAQGYLFSVNQASYNNLVAPTSLTNGATWDDPNFSVPIDFPFSLYATSLTDLYINENGLGAFFTASQGTNGISPLFVAYGPDIIDRGYDFTIGDQPTGGLSDISYETSGSTGNRITKIEYKNVGFYNDIDLNGNSNHFVNFQIWLYESNNDIEIHFGPSSITEPLLCYDGELGPNISLYSQVDLNNQTSLGSGITLTGNAANPTAIASNLILNENIIGNVPNSTVYRFTRTLLNTEELRKENPSFSVSPNPTNGNLHIKLNSDSDENVQFVLSNQLGQTIQLFSSDKFLNNHATLDLTTFENGLYFLSVTNKGFTTVKRIVKQ